MEENGTSASRTTLVSRGGYEVSSWQRCLLLVNTFYHQILATLTVVMFWIFFKSYDWDSTRLWHLVFSTAAVSKVHFLVICSLKFLKKQLIVSKSVSNMFNFCLQENRRISICNCCKFNDFIILRHQIAPS